MKAAATSDICVHLRLRNSVLAGRYGGTAGNQLQYCDKLPGRLVLGVWWLHFLQK